MKTIPLTQGKQAIVDDDDYEELSKHKWCAKQSRNDWYAIRQEGKAGAPTHRIIRMHRQIMGPIDPKMETDHINGDSLDNRKSNLRTATKSQNRANSKRPSNNTSGHKGVSWDKSRGKWFVHVQVETINIFIGRFEDLKTAIKAAKSARKQFHKEFTRHV